MADKLVEPPWLSQTETARVPDPVPMKPQSSLVPPPWLKGSSAEAAPIGEEQGPPMPKIGQGEALSRGMAQGATLNFGDELSGLRAAGGLEKPLDEAIEKVRETKPDYNPRRSLIGTGLSAVYGAGKRLLGGGQEEYERAVGTERAANKLAEEQWPKTYMAGEVAGSLPAAAAVPQAQVAKGANVLQKMANSAVAGAEFGATMGFGKGEGIRDSLETGGIDALLGLGVGAAVPAVVGIGQTVLSPFVNTARGVINPEGQAAKTLFASLAADQEQITAGKAKGLPLKDWLAAKAAGEPVTLMDLGAGNTQSLLRSAANTSPEARAQLEKMITDRFESQADRVAREMRSATGSPADALKTAEQLLEDYNLKRGGYYKTAFSQPGAQAMWTPELEQIAQSPTVQSAIKMAMLSAREEAAKIGVPSPPNPFRVNPDGSLDLVTRNGATMYPNLQFWDVVKKRLDGLGQEGQGWSRILRGKLDDIVPEYGAARGFAANFFGERDALEAGRKLAGKNADPSVVAAVLKKLDPEELDLFRVGYTSDYANRVIENFRNTRDITKAMMNSPAQNKMIETVLGKPAFDKLQARITLEAIMDGARRALGNSTTARQLVELGLASGAGALASGYSGYGSGTGAGLGALSAAMLAAKGNPAAAGQILQGAFQRVAGVASKGTASRVAEMLTSDDPTILAQGMKLLQSNAALRKQVENIANVVGQAAAPQADRIGKASGGEVTSPFGLPPVDIEGLKKHVDEVMPRPPEEYPGDKIPSPYPEGMLGPTIAPAMATELRTGDDGLQTYYDKAGKPLDAIPRPGVLPFYRDPQAGIRMAMPGLLDIAGNAMPGLGAAAVGMTKAPQAGVLTAFGARAPEAAAAAARQLTPLGFYSHGAESVAAMPQARGSAEQMVAYLQNKAGVKPVELYHAGLTDETGKLLPEFAGQQLTKEQLAERMKTGQPVVEETVLGGPPKQPEGYRVVTADEIRELHRIPSNQHLPYKFYTINESGRIVGGGSSREAAESVGAYSQTKYQNYTIPGGENYREVLLKYKAEPKEGTVVQNPTTGNWVAKLPDGSTSTFDTEAQAKRAVVRWDSFRSSHWDEPNVLAHVRMSDRTAPDGQKLLHVEEIQSDWGQKGKAEGFRRAESVTPELEKQKLDILKKANATNPRFGDPNFLESKIPSLVEQAGISEQEAQILRNYVSAKRGTVGISPAPYVTSTQGWTDLALKRVLKEAAEGGYDRVIFTPGTEQAKRYDLSKQISKIEYHDNNSGGVGKASLEGDVSPGKLTAYDHDGRRVIDQYIHDPSKLPEYIGKEAAKKLLEQQATQARLSGSNARLRSLSGIDLSVGGEGMKGYYDKIIPAQLQKLTKKLDPNVKVEPYELHDTTHHKGKVTRGNIMDTIPQLRGASNEFRNRYWTDLTQDEIDALVAKYRSRVVTIPTISIPITPALRENVLKGLPSFASGGSVLERMRRASGGRTEAQIEAGNYKKHHTTFQGLPITIENRKGTLRSGVGRDGKPWSVKMPAHYGYIKRTEGADGDHVDVYLGPHALADQVFIVDQKDLKTGRFDEHKCILGCASRKEAEDLYLAGFSDGKGRHRLGAMTTMSVDEFKDWLKEGNTRKEVA